MGRSIKKGDCAIQNWPQRRDHMCPEITQFIRTPQKPLPHVHHRLHGLSSRDDHGADYDDCNVERRALLNDRNSTDTRGKIINSIENSD